MTRYKTPAGKLNLQYDEALKQPHLLIAGATGSGKSVIVNGLIYNALYHSPAKVQFILIDPKRVELSMYKDLPHTITYASEPWDMVQALQYAMTLTARRFREMQKRGLRKYDGSDVYVVIDEFADLILTQKKTVKPLIQRLAQVGRAARVHIILCTQTPISAVIPTEIKCNFDSRYGLRTRSAQDSRNIIGVAGCETLPKYGQAYYMSPDEFTLYNIHMYRDAEITERVRYWTRQKNFIGRLLA